MFLVKAFPGLNGWSAFFLLCHFTGLVRSVELSLCLCQGETHFFNYIISKSENHVSPSFLIFFCSPYQDSPLCWLEFHSRARAFAEQRGKEVTYWLNCYYSTGLQQPTVMWMRGPCGGKITGERHESKPIEASFTKFIHKKKSVCFWVLTVRVLLQ